MNITHQRFVVVNYLFDKNQSIDYLRRTYLTKSDLEHKMIFSISSKVTKLKENCYTVRDIYKLSTRSDFCDK